MKKENLKIIRERFPEIAYLLENSKVPSSYQLVQSRTGSFYILKLSLNGREYFPHSLYDPEREAYNYIKKALENTKNENITVIYGFGLGYHFFNIMDIIPKNRKILIIEADIFMFKLALGLFDFSKLFSNRNIELIVGDNLDYLNERLAKIYKLDDKLGVDIVEIKRIVKINPDYYRRVSERLKGVLSVGVSNYTTVIKHLDQWQEHIFKNIRYMVKSGGVLELKDKFKGKPAFVVAAGPSLDKNYYLLRDIKGRFPIITVDTAYKILLKKGIKPDLVVSVDGQPENYKHLKGIKERDVYLVASPIVYPKTVSEFPGRILFFNFQFPLSLWLEENLKPKGILTPGGSVATIAFDLARLMGADPIIFVGQDLAFSGMRMHASGHSWEGDYYRQIDIYRTIESFEYEHIFFSDKTVVPAVDIYGKRVYTYRVMLDYANWFFYEFKRTDANIINATEGGILNQNVDIMDLSMVINRYCKGGIDVKRVLNDSYIPAHNEQIDKLNNRLIKILKNLKRIKIIANDAEHLANKLVSAKRSGDIERLNRLKYRLAKLGNDAEELAKVAYFINYAFQKEFWPKKRFIMQKKEMFRDDEEFEFAIMKAQYDSLYHSSKRLCELIEAALNE